MYRKLNSVRFRVGGKHRLWKSEANHYCTLASDCQTPAGDLRKPGEILLIDAHRMQASVDNLDVHLITQRAAFESIE